MFLEGEEEVEGADWWPHILPGQRFIFIPSLLPFQPICENVPLLSRKPWKRLRKKTI